MREAADESRREREEAEATFSAYLQGQVAGPASVQGLQNQLLELRGALDAANRAHTALLREGHAPPREAAGGSNSGAGSGVGGSELTSISEASLSRIAAARGAAWLDSDLDSPAAVVGAAPEDHRRQSQVPTVASKDSTDGEGLCCTHGGLLGRGSRGTPRDQGRLPGRGDDAAVATAAAGGRAAGGGGRAAHG